MNICNFAAEYVIDLSVGVVLIAIQVIHDFLVMPDHDSNCRITIRCFYCIFKHWYEYCNSYKIKRIGLQFLSTAAVCTYELQELLLVLLILLYFDNINIIIAFVQQTYSKSKKTTLAKSTAQPEITNEHINHFLVVRVFQFVFA